MNHYETVFILTPVLSDAQMKEAVEKFKNVLVSGGAQILNEENWSAVRTMTGWMSPFALLTGLGKPKWEKMSSPRA